MPHPDDDYGPYGHETVDNTSTSWLSDISPVKAKLSGMVDYAQTMSTLSLDLATHQMRVLQQMQQIMPDAFAGGFPEVKYAFELQKQNLTEFNTYLQNLHDGIDHIANASKAIADSYGDSDSFASISLNTVQFAFADPNAKRPAGLPKGTGQTFSEKAAADEAKGGTAGKPDPLYLPTSTVMNADGGMTQTYKDQYGDVRTITISYTDGHQVTTTTDPSGTTVEDSVTVSYPFGSYTTTTTTDPKGKVSTSTSNSYSSGDTYTTDQSDNGKPTTETTVTTNPDGSQTTTIYNVDGTKKTIATQVSVGADNPVDNGLPDSPADDAENQIRASMPVDPPPKNTKILAPGPLDVPGDTGSSGSAGTTSV
ncbi:MAG TPA: hypothetical protein VGJ28_14615 [Micromonosporaceae bacterium]